MLIMVSIFSQIQINSEYLADETIYDEPDVVDAVPEHDPALDVDMDEIGDDLGGGELSLGDLMDLDEDD